MLENLLSGGLTDGLSAMLSSVIQSLPAFISALFIIIIGIIISKFIARMIKKFLSKIGIDKLGEQLNDIDIIQKLNTDVKISAVFSKIVYYFLLFIFIIAATDVLNMSSISDLVMNAFNMIPKLLVALIILILGTLLADGIRKVLLVALESLGIPSAKLISAFLFYFLFINVVISAIAQAEINTTFLEQNISIVIGGIVAAFAIGYGLASKDVVANFLGSFYAEDKIHEGDKITIDGETGVVKHIDRNAITIDADGREIVFPLGIIMKQKLILHNKK